MHRSGLQGRHKDAIQTDSLTSQIKWTLPCRRKLGSLLRRIVIQFSHLCSLCVLQDVLPCVTCGIVLEVLPCLWKNIKQWTAQAGKLVVAADRSWCARCSGPCWVLVIWYDIYCIWYDMIYIIWCGMIYMIWYDILLTAVGLTPGCSSTVQHSTHLQTNNLQNNTMKQNTQNGTYITIRIHKHKNKNT